MKAALRLAPSLPSILGGTRRLTMVSLRLFLRVLLPFEVYEGWRVIEGYLSSPPKCTQACVPQAFPSKKREYRAPHVKFAADPDETSPAISSSSSSSSSTASCSDDTQATQPSTQGSEKTTVSPEPPRRSRADAIEDRGPSTPRRPRRTRSVLGRDEAQHYTATGEPETLFCDTSALALSRSFRSGAGTPTLAPHELDLLALKAELYDKASFHHRQTIDELSQELADVQAVLSSTEAEVERILMTNAKLHRQVKELALDQRYVEEWIYSVQAPLTQLGIFPSFLNEKLTLKMKGPRPYPTLSPHVASRLASSDEYFTPPSTPPPPKAQALKPEKRALRPLVRPDPDWEGEAVFGLSSPLASPSSSRPGSPAPFACSSPKPSRLRSPSPST
ncbi:hypothetical protein EIP86_009699 [Pleurotus ostreatoroseus]|nr:hypothetical protein EIP86_009699 [Pleurotus ostreatoroseus]